MNRSSSPLIKVLLVGLFFAVTLLLSGVCFHHDVPKTQTQAQQTAKVVSGHFKQDTQAWNRLAEKDPLLLLRLASRE